MIVTAGHSPTTRRMSAVLSDVGIDDDFMKEFGLRIDSRKLSAVCVG
jgi:uncharacterized membrane protein